MVVDGAGNVVQPMTKENEDTILGWMPNSSEVLVRHQVRARSWREYAPLLGSERAKFIVESAAFVSHILHDYHGDWAKFGTSTIGQLLSGQLGQVSRSYRSQIFYYLEETHPNVIAGLVNAARHAKQVKKPGSKRSGDSGLFLEPDDLTPPWIIELHLREAVGLANSSDRAVFRSADEILWAQASPNGRTMAYSAASDNVLDVTFHVFVISLQAGARPQQVDEGNESAESAVWSPDGQYLAFLASSNPARGYDENVAFDHIERRHVCDAAGNVISKPDYPDTLAFLAPTSSSTIAWLPGDTLLFASQTMPAVKGEPTKALFTLQMLPKGVPDILERQLQNENVDSFVASPDGERVAITDDHGRVSIYDLKTRMFAATQDLSFDWHHDKPLPSWKDATDLSYVVPAFGLPGEPLRSDQVVLATIGGDKRVISESWPSAVGFLYERYVVDIKGDVLSHGSLTVPIGSTVTWMNNDAHPHALKGDDGSGGFDSKNVGADETFSVTFNKAGTFAYACSLHPSMRGTIIVESPRNIGGTTGK
jgi:plastocyanin